MKKVIYILLFIVLGFLAQLLIHGVVEISYIYLLTTKNEIFGLGLSYDMWFRIHDIGGVLLLVAGLLFGYFQGIHWWKIIYK